jgi:hypothetical protein
VVWVEELSTDAPARYDVGMRYLDCNAESLALLQSAMQGQAG